MEELPEIRYLKVPKLFLPVFLFSFVLAAVFVIYKNQSGFAFGKIFGNRVVEAQGSGDWNKIGVNAAVPVSSLDASAVRNIAALIGPGGSIVGIVDSVGDVAATQTFITEASRYCLTPVLRLEAKNVADAGSWGGFFQQVGSNNGKLVVFIGNEVNMTSEWNRGDSPQQKANNFGRYLNAAFDSIKSAAPNAIVLGPALNTTAPCPTPTSEQGNYMCWQDFVKWANEAAPGVWAKLNGHASNAYPLAPDGPAAEGSYRIYNWEKNFINNYANGYSSKDVYITETGLQGSWWRDVPGWSDRYGYLNQVMTRWNDDASVVMVNFFNAAGDNPGWIGAGGHYDPDFVFAANDFNQWNGGGSVSNPAVKFSKANNCEIVDPDEYESVYGKLAGTCVTDTQTPLFPGTKELKGKENATLLLKEGFGNVAGIMSIESVTVAEYIQGTEIESKGDTPPHSNAAEFGNALSYDVYYNLKPNYPADGTVEAEANITVASWVNQQYLTDNDLGDEYIPLDTSNDVSDFPEGSSGYGEGFGVIKKVDYVYFPLGTALGAVVQDPFNYFSFYKRPSDIITEAPVSFDKSFLGEQSAHVDFFINKLGQLLEFLGEIKRLLGFRGLLDLFRLGTPSPKSAVMDGNEVNIEKYYRGDRAPGEQGIELGEFIFQQDCEAFDGTVGKYDSTIIGFENEITRIRGCTAGEPDCPVDKVSAINELNRKIDNYRTQQGKVSGLASECHGEGKRRAKIEGKLSLTAPFVPILAHERYKDIYYTSAQGDPRPVCNAPEEGLYAAEVKVNVKFYDRNQAKFNAYKTCKPYGETGGNLLTDGFMETKGKGFEGVSGVVPGGWDAFWKKKPDVDGDFSDYGKAPEFVIQGRDPDPRRVLQGNTALKWFTAFSTHDVVMYEIINLRESGSYDLSGYYQGWRVQYDSPDTGPCPLSDPSYTGGSFSEVCVIEIGRMMGGYGFPSGDVGEDEFNDWINRYIDNNQYAHCSRIDEGMDRWNEHFVTGNFRGMVAVVVRGASPQFPVEVNDDYWDNFCFVQSGNLFDQEYQSIEVPEPQIEIGECPLVKRPLGSCKIQGIGGISDTVTLINEDLDFYMPGLGVIPYLRERIVVGDAKSPDRKAADLKYCEVDPEKPFPYPISYLDIYIIQNLQPESLAIKWAKAIYPKFEVGDVVAIRNGDPIEQDPKFAKLWEEMEEKNKAEINGGEVWIE